LSKAQLVQKSIREFKELVEERDSSVRIELTCKGNVRTIKCLGKKLMGLFSGCE